MKSCFMVYNKKRETFRPLLIHVDTVLTSFSAEFPDTVLELDLDVLAVDTGDGLL